jgi:hypothetical protein
MTDEAIPACSLKVMAERTLLQNQRIRTAFDAGIDDLVHPFKSLFWV